MLDIVPQVRYPPSVMTYKDLLTSIYAGFDRLLAFQKARTEEGESAGAFVFLPGQYATARTFNSVRLEFWPAEQVCGLLAAGMETDEGFQSLLADTALDDEFLVVIIDQHPGAQRQAVHVHRITNLGLN